MAALAFPVGSTRSRARTGAGSARQRIDARSQQGTPNLRVVESRPTTHVVAYPSRRSGADAGGTIHFLQANPKRDADRVRIGLGRRGPQAYAPITPLRRTEIPEPVRIIALPARPEDPAVIQEREIARRVAARRRARIARMRRRRLLALSSGVATVAVFVAVWLGAGALSSMHSSPLRVLPGSVKTAGGYLYTVHAGDTIWSIASRLTPTGDPRPIVDQIEAETGSTSLEPGSQILLP